MWINYVTNLFSLKVVHAKKIAFLGTRLGTFKIDVGTVYNQAGTKLNALFAITDNTTIIQTHSYIYNFNYLPFQEFTVLCFIFSVFFNP